MLCFPLSELLAGGWPRLTAGDCLLHVCRRHDLGNSGCPGDMISGERPDAPKGLARVNSIRAPRSVTLGTVEARTVRPLERLADDLERQRNFIAAQVPVYGRILELLLSIVPLDRLE